MSNAFAFSQFTTKHQNFEQDLEVCSRLGIGQVELCEDKLGDDPSVQRQRLAELRALGIRPCSIQTKVHSIFPDRLAPEPKEPDERLQAYCRFMDLFAEYFPLEGLPFVCITGAAPDDDFRHGWEVARDSLRFLAERAATHGFRIALEAEHPYLMQRDTFICTLDESLRLIDEAEAPQLGIVADLWHVWQEPDIAERLRAAAERVLMVHVSDWPRGGPRALDDRFIPGDGCIPLHTLLEALAEGGYDDALCVEILSDKSLPDSPSKLPPAEVVERSQAAINALTQDFLAHANNESGHA